MKKELCWCGHAQAKHEERRGDCRGGFCGCYAFVASAMIDPAKLAELREDWTRLDIHGMSVVSVAVLNDLADTIEFLWDENAALKMRG